jgi:hypothetical protein
VKNLDLQKVYDCYLSDPYHIEKDHIEAGKGIDVCVKSTIDVLENDGAVINEVEKDGEVIGYFSSVVINEYPIMQFWFIKPAFRKKDFVIYFWMKVLSFFKGLFYTTIYCKNEKALIHLKKQGFVEFINTDNKIILKCQQEVQQQQQQ